MNISASDIRNNTFPNADAARAYAEAQKIRAKFDAVSKDVVQLDNRAGVDANSNKGFVVLNQAQLFKLVHKSGEALPEGVAKLEENTSGEARVDDKGQVASLNISDGRGDFLIGEHSNGFLHAGQDRLVITEHKAGDLGETIATFFSDGSVGYKLELPSIGPG